MYLCLQLQVKKFCLQIAHYQIAVRLSNVNLNDRKATQLQGVYKKVIFNFKLACVNLTALDIWN